MRTRARVLFLAAALTLGAVAAPMIGVRVAAADRIIVVQPGQTLGEIAVRAGVTVERLVRLNNLADPNRIFAGQRLRVPEQGGATAPRSPEPAMAAHRVAHGETLWGIAVRYRTTVAAIAAANDISNAAFIRVGQVLRIPGAKAQARGRAPRSGQVGAPNGAMRSDMAALVAKRQDIARLIVAEARRQGVPAAFALAVAWQESGWQPRVVSSAGAIGVMQLLPSTAEWVGATMLGRGVDPWDPASNVRAGVRLLKHYLDRYHGSHTLALAAYYQGQTAADRHGVYQVSRPYIASILQLARTFSS